MTDEQMEEIKNFFVVTIGNRVIASERRVSKRIDRLHRDMMDGFSYIGDIFDRHALAMLDSHEDRLGVVEHKIAILGRGR